VLIASSYYLLEAIASFISTRYLLVMEQQDHIRELINRLARLDAGDSWGVDLNPSQRTVLDFLSRANRFSRSPSQVAEYMGTTRGTISQTLKSLGKKGYISESRSETDKRAISYELTAKGRAATRMPGSLELELADLAPDRRDRLATALSELLAGYVAKNRSKPFGICQTCRHFSPRAKGGFCALLSERLSERDATKICHEQVPT